MAGFVVEKTGYTEEFHIGGTDISSLYKNRLGEIDYVQLDGDELNSILHRFNNIPMNVKRRVNIYRGEFARFIVENW